MKYMERANTFISGFERILMIVCTIIMFITMLIVVIDVLMRYVFNHPLGWAYDLISLYLMVAITFFALSDALHADHHVSVDMLQKKMTDRLRHFFDAIGYLLSSFVFAGILYTAIIRMNESYVAGDALTGIIPWPTWIYSALVAIGSLAMLLRIMFRFIGHGISFAIGKSVIELPSLSGTADMEEL